MAGSLTHRPTRSRLVRLVVVTALVMLGSGCLQGPADPMPLRVTPPTIATASPRHTCPRSLIQQATPLTISRAQSLEVGQVELAVCQFDGHSGGPGTPKIWLSSDKPEWAQAISTDVRLPEGFTVAADRVLLIEMDGGWYQGRPITAP